MFSYDAMLAIVIVVFLFYLWAGTLGIYEKSDDSKLRILMAVADYVVKKGFATPDDRYIHSHEVGKAEMNSIKQMGDEIEKRAGFPVYIGFEKEGTAPSGLCVRRLVLKDGKPDVLKVCEGK